MESPPPYRPKPKKTGLVVGLIIGGVLLCCIAPIGGIAGFGYWGLKKIGPMATCGMSMKAMRDATLAFAEDNGGKLPTAATWQDQVRPYYEKELATKEEFKKGNPFAAIPVAGDWGCEADNDVKTGIAFNAALSGKMLKDVEDPAGTMLLFETTERKANLSMKYDSKNVPTPPKRFPTPGWMVAPVSGDTKYVNTKGKEVEINFGDRK